MKKVTLKQIADQAGVSLTTVHRVLNGKGGASKAVEEEILTIARDQGYSVNLSAANLRTHPLHIALVFPTLGKASHYFINRMLNGYLAFRSEVTQLNVVFQEFYFGTNSVSTDEARQEFEDILKNIYRDQPVHYDGVVIYGMMITPKSEAIINRIVGRGTKVVVMEYCPEGLFDVCSTQVDDTIAGSLAGDLIARSTHNPGTVLIINQKLAAGDSNGQACARLLQEERPDLQVVQEDLILQEGLVDPIAEFLQKHPNLQAVYVTSARHTKSLLTAMIKTGIRPATVIGSELYEDTYNALHTRELHAVIDKRPEMIGYDALYLLFNCLFRKIDLPAIHRITPRIVLRANSSQFFLDRENRYGISYFSD